MIPTDLSDCVLWLDAEDGLSGSGNWLDKSGAGNHATKGISPVVDPVGINGRQAMLFSRAAHTHLDLPSGIFETGGGTTFVVAKIRTFLTTGTKSAFLLAAQTVGSGADRWRWYIYADPNSLRFALGGNTNTDTTPHILAHPAIEETPYIIAARSDGTTAFFSTRCPRKESSKSLPSLTGAGPRVVIGRINTDSDTEEWDGWMGEIIHYDRALSDAEVLTVEAYLSGRWAVSCGGFVVGAVSIG